MSNLTIETKYSASVSGNWMFGSRTTYGVKDTYALYLNSADQYWLQSGGADSKASTYVNITTTGTHTLKITQSNFTYDGSDVATITSNKATLVSSKYSLHLGAMNSGGVIDSRIFNGNIYYFKIYDGTTLLRNYIPVRSSNGEVGLLNIVNYEFYTSKTSTAFVAGPAV